MTRDVREAAQATWLLREWQHRSLATVWLRPGDWFTPAVEALADALEAGADVAPAAFRLGQARQDAGVSITEAIDDMAVLFRVAGHESTPLRAIRSLCAGWVEEYPGSAPTMTDAESGLATGEYLVQRLAEEYGAADRAGTAVPHTHALVVVDVSLGTTDPWERMARNAAVGQALMDAYGGGHPMARVGDGLYVVVVARGPQMGEGMERLKGAIQTCAVAMHVGTLVRQPPRVWVEALPSTWAAARALVESLPR